MSFIWLVSTLQPTISFPGCFRAFSSPVLQERFGPRIGTFLWFTKASLVHHVSPFKLSLDKYLSWRMFLACSHISQEGEWVPWPLLSCKTVAQLEVLHLLLLSELCHQDPESFHAWPKVWGVYGSLPGWFCGWQLGWSTYLSHHGSLEVLGLYGAVSSSFLSLCLCWQEIEKGVLKHHIFLAPVHHLPRLHLWWVFGSRHIKSRRSSRHCLLSRTVLSTWCWRLGLGPPRAHSQP